MATGMDLKLQPLVKTQIELKHNTNYAKFPIQLPKAMPEEVHMFKQT